MECLWLERVKEEMKLGNSSVCKVCGKKICSAVPESEGTQYVKNHKLILKIEEIKTV